MTENITLTTNTKKILLSGSVITFYNEDLNFDFPVGSGNLTFTIKFINDNSNNQMMETKKINDKTLILELTNFNNSIGVGNFEVLKLGTMDRKELSLNIVVRKLSDSVNYREINYTFYLDK